MSAEGLLRVTDAAADATTAPSIGAWFEVELGSVVAVGRLSVAAVGLLDEGILLSAAADVVADVVPSVADGVVDGVGVSADGSVVVTVVRVAAGIA